VANSYKKNPCEPPKTGYSLGNDLQTNRNIYFDVEYEVGDLKFGKSKRLSAIVAKQGLKIREMLLINGEGGDGSSFYRGDDFFLNGKLLKTQRCNQPGCDGELRWHTTLSTKIISACKAIVHVPCEYSSCPACGRENCDDGELDGIGTSPKRLE
jgi:hypothetical protein